jgi:hypothetical protein
MIATGDLHCYFDAQVVLDWFDIPSLAKSWDLVDVFCCLIHKYLTVKGESSAIVYKNVHSDSMELLLFVWFCCQTGGARDKRNIILSSLLPPAPLFDVNLLFHLLSSREGTKVMIHSLLRTGDTIPVSLVWIEIIFSPCLMTNSNSVIHSSNTDQRESEITCSHTSANLSSRSSSSLII